MNGLLHKKRSRLGLLSIGFVLILILGVVLDTPFDGPATAQPPHRQEQKSVSPQKNFTFYRQRRKNDCGAACLRMICTYYGKEYSEKYLVERLRPDKQGVSLLALSDLSEELGFTARAVAIGMEQLLHDAPMPCIVHWQEHHFIVVCKADAQGIAVADPGDTLRTYDTATFRAGWYSSRFPGRGVALLLETK